MERPSLHARTLPVAATLRPISCLRALALAAVVVVGACGSGPAEISEAVEPAGSDTPFVPSVGRKSTTPQLRTLDPLAERLAGLPQFGAAPGTTDKEWLALQADAAIFFDHDSGARGVEAEERLVGAGQAAWPALINQLIKLDLEDPEDNRMGSRGTLALSRARGSDSPYGFDWRSGQDSATGQIERNDLYFNYRLLTLLHEAWAKVLEDPLHWKKFDKSDTSR